MNNSYHSGESEKAFLSCILLDPTIMHFMEVEPIWIYLHDNMKIFSEMKRLYEEKRGIDLPNLISKFPDMQDYLYDISLHLMTTANRTDYQDTIKKNYQKREIAKLTRDIQFSLENDDNITDIQQKIKKGTDYLTISKDGINFFEAALEVIDGIQDQGERICKYGYPILDKHLGGYKEGQLIIIGARPGVGKTAFTVNLIEKIAQQDVKCCLYSLEMTNKEIVRRMLCSWANVNMGEVEDPKNKEKLMDVYVRKANEGFNFKLFDDIYKFSEIEQSIRKEAIINGSKIFFIDHIGLIRGMKGDNKNNRLGHVSSSLKILAKELRIDIVCLSQLNRGSAQKSLPPQLHDLRDSGNIEQDADVVMMLHREENYNDSSMNENEMLLLIRKARNAKQGSIPMETKMDYMIITEKPFNTKQKKND